MEENQAVGYRFHPTDEELINHYLKNKIMGKQWLINKVNEININSHDPDSFPSLSKIKSKDSTYYFFAPTVYISAKKTARKRSTRSGYWKPTGKDRIIKDKNGNKIGEKKTLVYHCGKVNKGVRTPWVMHEYLIKSWSHPDSESYVMCKIKYKGEDGEPSQSLVQDSNTVKAIISAPREQVPCGVIEKGLTLDDLDSPMPIMNKPDEEFDPNTYFDGLFPPPLQIFSDSNNNNLNVPLQAPYDVARNDDVTWDPNTWVIDQELEIQQKFQKECNEEAAESLFTNQELEIQQEYNGEAAQSWFIDQELGIQQECNGEASQSWFTDQECIGETIEPWFIDQELGIQQECIREAVEPCLITEVWHSEAESFNDQCFDCLQILKQILVYVFQKTILLANKIFG